MFRTFAALCSMLLAVPVAAHHAPGPVRIAAVLSISGPAAGVGEPQLKALQLQVEQLNRAGGLLTHKVELFHADDESDPRKAAVAARRLATPEFADFLIGGSTTSTALAIIPVMQAARIPFIAIAPGIRLGEPHRAWVFHAPPSESQSLLRILDDLARRDVKRVGLLTSDTETGRNARREIREYTDSSSLYFRKAGIVLAADRTFGPQDSEGAARALEQALRAREVGALIVSAVGNGAVAIAKRHREMKSPVPLYFSQAAAVSRFVDRAGTAAEGLRMTVPPMLVVEQLPDADPQKRVILDFIASYGAKYGAAPPPAAGYAADALMLAANAVQVAKSLDFSHLRQVLEGTRQFVGVTGTYNFWATDHRTTDPKSLRLVEIRAGVPALLD